MIRDDVAFLIQEEPKSRGVTEKAERSEYMVYCQVKSVSRSDVWKAKAIGLDPEIVLVIADPIDYHGERIVVYNNKEYEVLRTYDTGAGFEITLQRARGFAGDAEAGAEQ